MRPSLGSTTLLSNSLPLFSAQEHNQGVLLVHVVEMGVCNSSIPKEVQGGDFSSIAGVDNGNPAAEKKRTKGNAEFEKKNYDSAMRLYSEALEIDPADYR